MLHGGQGSLEETSVVRRKVKASLKLDESGQRGEKKKRKGCREK